ncbi:MAG TPA: hypothetical protein VGM27_28145 [Acidobacteriaceae bacterium]|jgi:hypothetical protein
MNKLVRTLVTASVLVSGSAFAQDQAKHASDKQPLRDSQMDSVTAGSAIAIDAASVTTTDTGSVNLSGTALSGASSVNIVNSSNSLVANGVNIYDSSLTSQDTNSGATVNQININKQKEKNNANVAVAATVTPIAFAAEATATNIAALNGTINTNTNNSVDLSGAAEQNASALNIVNSAGGMVANGVNVARSANINSMPTLNQVNLTTQTR